MKRCVAIVAGLLSLVTLFGSLAHGEDKELILSVTCKGKHFSPGGYGAAGGYPFDLSGEVAVSAGALSEGGEYALNKIFSHLVDKKNGNAKVTKVTGELKLSESKVSGTVRVEWEIHGNPFWIYGDIEGSVEMDEGVIHAIKFACVNVGAGGAWNWGVGGAQLGGSGEMSVTSREKKQGE